VVAILSVSGVLLLLAASGVGAYYRYTGYMRPATDGAAQPEEADPLVAAPADGAEQRAEGAEQRAGGGEA